MAPVLVLAIDTSTPDITVGVVDVLQPHEVIAALESQREGGSTSTTVDPNRVIAERIVTDAFGHVEKLLPLVTDIVTEADGTLSDVDAIVVGIGPGPYTGLRVGMATAAALGDALDIPVHGIPSHDGIAAGIGTETEVLVVTDARRREVYVSGYDVTGVRVLGPVVVAPTELPALLGDFTPNALAGPGARIVETALGMPLPHLAGSAARGLVRRAHRELVTGAVPGPLTPLYLRRPDAAEPHAPKPALPETV